MKVIAGDVERVHLVVGHLDAFRVQVGVDLAADLQAGVGRRGADELDDDLMARQPDGRRRTREGQCRPEQMADGSVLPLRSGNAG